jgi:hypothetical protein
MKKIIQKWLILYKLALVSTLRFRLLVPDGYNELHGWHLFCSTFWRMSAGR